MPDSEIFSVEFDAFDTMDSVPLALPDAVGVKVAVNVTLWFAASVVGSVRPLIENADPVIFACEIVTDEPPVFVSVSDKLVLFPT